ncbi:ATP-binding protein [Sphingomonas cannabina]|uniref:AAA family ATPase n=1 Tax=Sphingomonas cannabina TaxID=2899123 RepID=UPI001F2E7303|nr:ATP-binding protein [Sphingomonas cannabina]UIJ46918.1 ATP-binding protein [Sphingomonas cannabina]
MTNITHLADTARSGPAQLTNMRLAMSTMLDCVDAPEGSPRLAVFHGPSGYGKSVAAAHIAAHFRAGYIEAKSIWTQRTLLEAIAVELGIVRLARTGPRLLEQIIEQLIHDPVPLVIDEMDHLVKKQSVEIIRDIHDGARVPVLMIGEESLPSKLKEWERFDNRILVATPAQPATIADALLLRDHYCTRVHVEDELVEDIATACKGVTRRIVVNLQEAQKVALGTGSATIGRDLWGDRRFRTGDLLPRRAA